MSVPKKRKTLSKTKKGRSHQALKKVVLTKCSKCKKSVKKHVACSFCGVYRAHKEYKVENNKVEVKDK